MTVPTSQAYIEKAARLQQNSHKAYCMRSFAGLSVPHAWLKSPRDAHATLITLTINPATVLPTVRIKSVWITRGAIHRELICEFHGTGVTDIAFLEELNRCTQDAQSVDFETADATVYSILGPESGKRTGSPIAC